MKSSMIRPMILLALLLCGLPAATAMSASVSPDKLIALAAGGPQQAKWQTQDLTIECNYTWNENRLSLSGGITFSDRLTMNYPDGLQQFYMEVVIVNGDGTVLIRRPVSVNTGYNWEGSYAFKAQITVTGEKPAMTFYYNGVTQGSKQTGEGMSFWYDPFSGVNR